MEKVNSILSGKLYVLTPETVAKWNLARNRVGRNDFGCLLCGTYFKENDRIRFIIANKKESPFKLSNFFVCELCDDGDERCLERASSLVENINPILMDRLK